jgi:hypothetical protein
MKSGDSGRRGTMKSMGFPREQRFERKYRDISVTGALGRKNKYADNPDGTLKAVFIPTPEPAMEIALNYNELTGFRMMLEAADSEMKAMVMIAALHG